MPFGHKIVSQFYIAVSQLFHFNSVREAVERSGEAASNNTLEQNVIRDSEDWFSSIKSIEKKEINVCDRLRMSAANILFFVCGCLCMSVWVCG